MATLHGLIHRLKSYNHTVSQNKQHHMKVLFSSFLKKGHTACLIHTTWKVRTTLYHKTNSTTWKNCSVPFERMATLHGLIHRLKSYNHTVSQNKQHHMKVLFSSFLKKGHTACLIHTTWKVRTTLYHKTNSTTWKNCSVAFQRMVTLHGLIRGQVKPHCIIKQSKTSE